MLPFLCSDCNEDIGDEYNYMIHNELWTAIIPKDKQHGFMCVKCLEERLGRKLNNSDFKWGVPLNYHFKGTELLESRKYNYKGINIANYSNTENAYGGS